MNNVYLQNNYLIVLFSFIFSFITTFLTVYPIKKVGYKFGFLDRLDSRKEYREEIVRIGGISIVSGLFISLFFTKFLIKSNLETELTYIIFFSFIFFLIGLSDDLLTIKPLPRLFFQIFFSFTALAFCSDLTFQLLNNFYFQDFNSQVFSLLGIFITVIWISGITNAINWTDGLDGLASFIAITIFTSLFFVFLHLNLFQYAIYSITLAGACYGFLFHNYRPASIIMGDGGSYFLGFNVAVLSLIASNNLYFQYPNKEIYTFLPLLLLAIPILDMLIVILTRISNLKSPFEPDRSHLHHRLLNLGFGYHKTIDTIIILNLIFSTITFVLISRYDFLFSSILLIVFLNLSVKKNFLVTFKDKLKK